MTCEKCGGELEVLRVCRSVKMRCRGCNSSFAIHEVIDRLDEQTEAELERFNVIIYD